MCTSPHHAVFARTTRARAHIRPLLVCSIRAAATASGHSLIREGDTLPDVELKYFDREGALQSVSTAALCAGKKVVLFAVPGAFTPTCSTKHVPGFVENAAKLREKGVDDMCVAAALLMRATRELARLCALACTRCVRQSMRLCFVLACADDKRCVDAPARSRSLPPPPSARARARSHPSARLPSHPQCVRERE